MHVIGLQNEFTAFSRRADAKIGLLKDIIERVQRGDDVDVKGLLGTGNPEKERAWEEVIKELEEEDRLWRANVRRRQKKEKSSSAQDPNKKKEPSSPESVGKCINFGLPSAQVDEAGSLLRILAGDWRELLAGSEGFLVGKGRAGLERHQVVWGEMDSMRAAARCVEDIVVYDYRLGQKTALKPFMLQQFRATWDAQERAKARNEGRVLELLAQVRCLEKASWDREGAVEDVGTA
ncbi:MAG: hypothetical protein L6R37_003387 [Teloschistes peruensis]|nr:MAG: hypothetical protein L6R37_003387 [Teloschistes peruensis]